MKFIKGARNWRSILDTQSFFFLASDPLSWSSLSHGLAQEGTPHG